MFFIIVPHLCSSALVAYMISAFSLFLKEAQFKKNSVFPRIPSPLGWLCDKYQAKKNISLMSPGNFRELFFPVHVQSLGPCRFFLQFFWNAHRKQEMVQLFILNTNLFHFYKVVFYFSYFKTSSCSYSFL